MSLTHNRRPLEAIGDRIVKQVGRVEITLQWVREGVYTVTTYDGTRRIDEHCHPYDNEEEARGYAYTLTLFYGEAGNYRWPCGCGDIGWIWLGLAYAPCGACNPDRTKPYPSEPKPA